jgi:hypothetical protein
MNRIEITILKRQAALDAFAETWRRVEAGEEAKRDEAQNAKSYLAARYSTHCGNWVSRTIRGRRGGCGF